jgi:hypothetical protein
VRQYLLNYFRILYTCHNLDNNLDLTATKLTRFFLIGGITGIAIARQQPLAMAIQALTLASISGRLLGGWIVMYLPIRDFTIGCALLQ